jgi:hypothetical protein
MSLFNRNDKPSDIQQKPQAAQPQSTQPAAAQPPAAQPQTAKS